MKFLFLLINEKDKSFNISKLLNKKILKINSIDPDDIRIFQIFSSLFFAICIDMPLKIRENFEVLLNTPVSIQLIQHISKKSNERYNEQSLKFQN